MKIKLPFVLIILISLQSFAQTSLRIYENDVYKNVKISEFQGAHLNSECIKGGKPQCKAWSCFLEKPKPRSKSNFPLAGDPAAQYCWDVEAKNRILKSVDNKQYDYCVFSDNSMIDSWDLYYKHFPRK